MKNKNISSSPASENKNSLLSTVYLNISLKFLLLSHFLLSGKYNDLLFTSVFNIWIDQDMSLHVWKVCKSLILLFQLFSKVSVPAYMLISSSALDLNLWQIILNIKIDTYLGLPTTEFSKNSFIYSFFFFHCWMCSSNYLLLISTCVYNI